MIFKPTRSRRNVVLVVHINKRATQNTARRHIETRRIVRISALFADHERITEGVFGDSDEATLLNNFWKAMRAGDSIFGADIASRLELVRRRSWILRVIPSAEIHLRQIYCHELLDTQRMWSCHKFSVPKDLTYAKVSGRLRY